MNKCKTAVILGLIAAIFCGSTVDFSSKLQNLQHSVLRLHILANSDSQEDQDLKCKVRDELLSQSDQLFSGCKTLKEMQDRAEEEKETIRLIAQNVLEKNGCTDKVSVQLVQMDFDEKQYEEITMPAGAYSALRILIGKAEGHNWWCVMYPPLCLSAGTETAEGWFDAETADILENPEEYEVKFKCVEWLEALREKTGR